MKYDKKDLERFWTKVDIRNWDECWEWLAQKDKDGYGRIKIKKKCLRAHRFSFFIHNGFVDKNLYVCHSCDNPSCVNPHHLWIGTNRDNQNDLVEKSKIINKKNKSKNMGEKSHLSKLKEEDVIAIRNLYLDKSILIKDIANKFDITITNVQDIVKNKTWKHVYGGNKNASRMKLNNKKANEIRKIYAKGNITRKKLGKMYGVTKNNIDKILANKIWTIK